jgi:glycosyltransferase involved in cell wall biosynthesis
MKIVLGSHYFFPHVGGIESVVESHAERLTTRGHDVTVVSSDIGADSINSHRDGYEIRRFKAWNPTETLGVPYPIPNPIDARQRLKDIFVEEDVDIAHIHGLNYLTTTQILRYVPPSLPIVLHQHTPFVEYPFPIQQIEQINDRTIGKWNLQQADFAFCINSAIEGYVKKLQSDVQTELLMNGVDTEFFNPDRAQACSPFDCDSSTPVFFTLSRMSQKKGVDILLEAIEQIDQSSVDIHFAIAGDGPMRENVEKASQNSESIEVIGKLSDEELAIHYAAADAFLFTSKGGEAFPTLTMIESYASGTPVIASKLAEDPIGVQNGVNSILVEPGNAKQLEKAIIELASNEKQLSNMSTQARKTAEEYFSIEDRIDQIESCYRSLINSHD